ncbi:MAG: aminotransferase class I/II-fold pyridoxal phosphate-dependent enzyme [Oligoflexia bacterium]|nr:aminotransferase class I/II-fold pyridoxal phosphate-dependent enzyme [Oligoflexia bacterium]
MRTRRENQGISPQPNELAQGTLGERLGRGEFVTGDTAVRLAMDGYVPQGQLDGLTFSTHEFVRGVPCVPALDLSGALSVNLDQKGRLYPAKPDPKFMLQVAKRVSPTDLLEVLNSLGSQDRIPPWVDAALRPELEAGTAVEKIRAKLPQQAQGMRLAFVFGDGPEIEVNFGGMSICQRDLDALITEVPLAEGAREVDRVAESFFRSRGIPVTKEPEKLGSEVAIVSGTSMRVLAGALHAICPEKNGRIFIPQGCFEPLIEIAGRYGEVCLIPTADTGFCLDATRLDIAVRSFKSEGAPSVLLMVDPVANVGATFSREQHEALAQVLVRHNMRAVVDELYALLPSKSSKDGSSLAALSAKVKSGRSERLYDRVVTITGTSKVLPDEHQRFGFACCGDSRILESLRKLAQAEGNIPSVIDGLILERGVEALSGWRGFTRVDQGRFDKGFKAVYKGIEAANKLARAELFSVAHMAETGFFACLCVKAEPFKELGVTTSADLADYIAVVAGVGSRPLDGMGLGKLGDKIAVRVNVSEEPPKIIAAAFERLGKLGAAVLERSAPTIRELIDQAQRDEREEER